MEDNIWHVYPHNDERPHDFHVRGKNSPYCLCPCEPEIKDVEGGILVIHNSYDGREGLEWANEILK